MQHNKRAQDKINRRKRRTASPRRMTARDKRELVRVAQLTALHADAEDTRSN